MAGRRRARDPATLAAALVILATPASPPPALAAAVTGTAQPIHRILGPAEPPGRAPRQLLRGTAAAPALTPGPAGPGPRRAGTRARTAPARLTLPQHSPAQSRQLRTAIPGRRTAGAWSRPAAQPAGTAAGTRRQRRAGSRR